MHKDVNNKQTSISKSPDEYWLFENNIDKHKERIYTEGDDGARIPTQVTCRHPFYYNINKHQAHEKRIYWVESTHIPPPFQNTKSSIKIKFKSCGNGQYTMEQKKRGRKPGFRSRRRENANMKTNHDVFDPFIDKFSLIKARRHRFEQNNERKKIFRPKKPFKEKEKSAPSEIVKCEGSRNDLHVKYEPKDLSKMMRSEHVTIDLKRVGLNFMDGKVDEKLLSSSISHFFKKQPNISLERMNRKDLTTLRKDGFIKTENCDPTNKENKPEKKEDCKATAMAKKNIMFITPEHLSKIKSKLKAVSYEKSKPNPCSTEEKYEKDHTLNDMGLSQDEAPNIIDDNRNTVVSECPESTQPPVLIPEKNSLDDDIDNNDKESPFVYLETKPDVEELNRKIQNVESSERSVDSKTLDRQISAMVEKGTPGSNCRQLEVFVCKRSTEDYSPSETDSRDKFDFTLARNVENEKNASDKGSDDVDSSSKSGSCSKKNSELSQAKLTSEIQVPKTDSFSTCSLFHNGISSTETTTSHSVSHVITDINSSSNSLCNHNSNTPTEYHNESNSNTKEAEKVLTNMGLEASGSICLDGNNEDVFPRNASEEIDTSSHDRDSPTVFPDKSNKIFQSPYSIPSVASGSSLLPKVFPMLEAKEPTEAACGYDSDETFVYDEDDEGHDEGIYEKLVRKNLRTFSRSNLPHSKFKIRDSVKDYNLKKLVYTQMNIHDSLKRCAKPLKAKKVTSDQKKGDILGKKLKVKIIRQKKKREADNETESQDLLLTISPHKKRVGKRGQKQSDKTSSSCIKLLDVFNFEDSSENHTIKTKKLLSPKYDDKVLRNGRPKGSKVETKKKKTLQSNHKAKTSYGGRRMKTKAYTAIENVDEDDLPKILPPKRRRNSKNNAAMKKKPAVVPDDMERLIQEFPRHNWLENKYKSGETPRNPPEEIQTTEELYEYSFDDEKMDTSDLLEENQSTVVTDNPVIYEHDARSNQQNVFIPEASEMTSESTNPIDEPEDAPDEDRLQIVTDVDKDGQDNEVMIPCTVPLAMAEVTSQSPELTEDQNAVVDIEEGDQGKVTQEPVESVVSSAQEEMTEHPRVINNALPPVPHLIKVPDNNQDKILSSNTLASPNPESCETVHINQQLAEHECTSAMSYSSASVALTESCSTPNTVESVFSNKDCIASTMPPEGQNVNTRKRRHNGEDSDEREQSQAEISTSEHIHEKNPKLSSKVMDIDNWKEIITAKVKNDINNQLQKTLTEFRELDQMASEKAREAEALRQLREQKLKDLQSIQRNNSEAEIKRILNEKLSMLERQPELKSDMSSPPPAHQRPKQNIRELLDKMDRSHSQTPIDCSTFSAFSARKTPLHSPNASMVGKHSTSAHTYTQVPSGRNDQKSETGLLQGNVPPAHESEQSCAIRASSAPVICNKNNLDKQSTSSDIRLSLSSRVSAAASNSRLCNGSKSGANISRPNEAYIDLSQSSKDSEREIQRELSRALAAKRQKQDSSAKQDVYKSKEITVNRSHHHNGEPFGTRQTLQPSNPQPLLNTKSKEIRGYPQYHQNAYTQQLVRPVSYATIGNSQNLNSERTISGACRQNASIPGMMRPHAVRLLGAAAVGNVQQTLDGRQAFTYASNIPLNTFPNTGSIRQGTPIRPVQGIVSPTQSHVRPPLTSGAAPLENGQLLRHIPITAARTIDDTQKAAYAQQAAISSTGLPSLRPQGYLRPLAPAISTKPQTTTLKIGNNFKKIPNNTDVLLNSSQQQQQQIQHQQQQSNMPMNINGKCIVCSKFALYLCSNCQQFWYCSPQCQLKHWVNHQHHCKTTSNVS